MALKNNKSLGQHWLKNRAILDEIARLALPITNQPSSSANSSAAPESANTTAATSTTAAPESASALPQCLEIGPGLGTLTSSLLRLFPQVVAVEYDQRLAENLPKSFPGKHLQVIHADILQTDIARLIEPPYVVVGNIPYYITSPIVHKLLQTSPLPEKIVLLMQKEVAERIAAEPGDHSLLSLEVQNLAEVSLGPVVPAAEFTPPPKVDSQVIVLTPYSAPQINPAYLELAKLGFSAPRKKLATNLAANPVPNFPANSATNSAANSKANSATNSAANSKTNPKANSAAQRNRSKADWQAILAASGINPDARAQDLDLWDWENLSQA